VKPRRIATIASAAIALAVGYIYYELSLDELEGKYDEEGFLSLAWAGVTALLVFVLLVVVARMILPDEE
jgi:hypothetical protein